MFFFRTLHYLDKMTIVENIIFIKDIKEKKMSRQIKIYSKRLHCEDNVDEECDKTKFHKFIFTDISHFGGIFILKTKTNSGFCYFRRIKNALFLILVFKTIQKKYRWKMFFFVHCTI